MRVKRRLALVAVGFGLASFSRAAHADEPSSEPIRVAFAAPPGCPNELSFTNELRARTARARPAWAGENARTFRVTITRHLGTMQGNLTIEDPRGAAAVREVTGNTCSEVVSALALITALAIDPHASTAAHPSAPASPPPSTPPPEAPPIPVLSWYAGLPASIAPPHLRLLTEDASGMPHPLPAWLSPPLAEHRGFAVTVGTHVGGAGGVAPSFTPVGSVFIELGRLEDELVSPAIRMWLSASAGTAVEVGHDSATFHFKATRLEACPVKIALGELVRVFPCVGFEAGAVEGQGNGTASPSDELRAWFATTLAGRTQWTLVDGAFLEAQGGLAFPFTQYAFRIRPATTLYQVPSVGGTLSAGVGLRFP